MGMFFQMSQEAHKEGDGARAKELADIGRQHQVKMQELHAEAASQIFKGEYQPNKLINCEILNLICLGREKRVS